MKLMTSAVRQWRFRRAIWIFASEAAFVIPRTKCLLNANVVQQLSEQAKKGGIGHDHKQR